VGGFNISLNGLIPLSVIVVNMTLMNSREETLVPVKDMPQMGPDGRISIAYSGKYSLGYNGKQLLTLPNPVKTTLNKGVAG
jgi:hypothetical protein